MKRLRAQSPGRSILGAAQSWELLGRRALLGRRRCDGRRALLGGQAPPSRIEPGGAGLGTNVQHSHVGQRTKPLIDR